MKSSKTRSKHKSLWKNIIIINIDHYSILPLDDSGCLCYKLRQKPYSTEKKMKLYLKSSPKNEQEQEQKPEKPKIFDFYQELLKLTSFDSDDGVEEDFS